jgi:hypothetical protein
LQGIASAVVSEWCQLVAVHVLKIHALVEEAQRANDISEPLAAAAASDPREGSVRAPEGQERNTPSGLHESSQRRSWLYRFFFGLQQ